MFGAIIIAEHSAVQEDKEPAFQVASWPMPWAAVEILGQAPIARLADDLKSVCDSVSVIANNAPESDAAAIHATPVVDGATERFANWKRNGFEAVLIVRCGAYVEFDATAMLSFHRKQACRVTRAFTETGPLDVWLLDPCVLPEHAPLLSALLSARPGAYHLRAYVNHLRSSHDFRRLVLDSFHARCRFRPQGSEVKPGIWVSDGAQIERSARLVAPVFVGRNVQISDECLITRGSNIESHSHVDFGTVVEDSSILSNTYVGIGLDLSHSIVHGRNLSSLRYNVDLEITDPVVIRVNGAGVRDHPSPPRVENDLMAVSSAE